MGKRPVITRLGRVEGGKDAWEPCPLAPMAVSTLREGGTSLPPTLGASEDSLPLVISSSPLVGPCSTRDRGTELKGKLCPPDAPRST